MNESPGPWFLVLRSLISPLLSVESSSIFSTSTLFKESLSKGPVSLFHPSPSRPSGHQLTYPGLKIGVFRSRPSNCIIYGLDKNTLLFWLVNSARLKIGLADGLVLIWPTPLLLLLDSDWMQAARAILLPVCRKISFILSLILSYRFLIRNPTRPWTCLSIFTFAFLVFDSNWNWKKCFVPD